MTETVTLALIALARLALVSGIFAYVIYKLAARIKHIHFSEYGLLL